MRLRALQRSPAWPWEAPLRGLRARVVVVGKPPGPPTLAWQLSLQPPSKPPSEMAKKKKAAPAEAPKKKKKKAAGKK